jgi:hypothetical protein
MAKQATTHVIEIETGIGEPAFIPLTLGQELQPISVGKKGMWRIESARVLDVHAFVYFDGTALFLQSADESASASVDGYLVGKAWTELHAPCNIEIGAARLRFRSLLAEPEAPIRARVRNNTGPPQPGQGVPLDPPSFPKADRPFRPGEFAGGAPPRVESTHLVEQGRMRAQTGPPAPGYRFDENVGRKMDSTGMVDPGMGGHGMGGHGMGDPEQGGYDNRTADMPLFENMSMTPVQQPALPLGMQQHMQQPYMQQPTHGMQPMPPGMTPMGPASGAYQPYGASGPIGPSAPYNTTPPGMMHGGYGSMTGGQVGGQPEGSFAYYVAKYKELSAPKRILVVLAPFCVAAAAYLLLFDAPQTRTTSLPAAPDAGLANAPPPTSAPVVQPQPQPPQPPTQPPAQPQPQQVQLVCPQGFVPYTIPISPGGPVPCVPIGTPMPPPPAATGTAPPPAAPPPPAPVIDAGQLASNRTLERQAVDFVAVNDYARAAAVYEQLQRQNPTNRVYAEAARILRGKADAGIP